MVGVKLFYEMRQHNPEAVIGSSHNKVAQKCCKANYPAPASVRGYFLNSSCFSACCLTIRRGFEFVSFIFAQISLVGRCMQINRDLYFVIFDYYSIFKAISFFEMCWNNKSIDVSKINLEISLFIFQLCYRKNMCSIFNVKYMK